MGSFPQVGNPIRPDIAQLIVALQCLPVGLSIFDCDLKLRFWNDTFRELLKFPDNLLYPGVPMAELFRFNALRGEYDPGNPDEQVQARLDLCLKFESHHLQRTLNDGVILDISGRPIYDAAMRMTGFVTIYQNVTLEKQYEQQLEAKNRELQLALEDLKRAQVGNAELEHDRRKYYELAVRDPLTDLFTRYYMEDAANRLIELHERSERARLGVLLLDIDHFKSINDTYGHTSGDTVLRSVAALVLTQTRRVDIPVRLGGDEFVIFFAGAGKTEVRTFAQRIRQTLAELRFENGLSALRISASIGVAEHQRGETLTELIERADAALYEAKRAGRNRVSVAH